MNWWGIWPVLFFIFAPTVSALSLDFANTPASINQNQEFSLDVSLSCTSCSDSYLRGVFYLSGTNYFGFTKNNSGTWINLPGSSASEYFQVLKDEIKEGSWSGKLTVKPDSADSAFTGPGNYNFKIGRYTSSGSVTWSTPVTITITGPTTTPEPPTSAPTSKPTSIPATPTHIIPTPQPTLTLTVTLTPTPTPPQVLSASDPEIIFTPTPTTTPSASPSLWPPIAMIIIGLGVLIGVFVWH